MICEDISQFLEENENKNTARQTDRQTDRHVFIWGLIQRKYIDYNFQISKNYIFQDVACNM